MEPDDGRGMKPNELFDRHGMPTREALGVRLKRAGQQRAVSWSAYTARLAAWDRAHPEATPAERDAYVRHLLRRLGL